MDRAQAPYLTTHTTTLIARGKGALEYEFDPLVIANKNDYH